jgi:uncharacterized RDD family membrane protein YckC
MSNFTLGIKRVLAAVIDFLLLAVASYIVIKLLGYNFEVVFAQAFRTNVIVLGTLALLETVAVWLWSTTPGMKLFSLNVTNNDGSRLSLGKSLLRGVLIFVEGSAIGLPFFGLIYIAWGINLLKLVITGTAFWDSQLHIQVAKK